MFTRAARGLNLDPAERAFLRLVKGVIVTAIIAAATAAWPFIASSSSAFAVNWHQVASNATIAFIASIAFSIEKYFTAQGDPPVPTAQPPSPMPVAPSAPTPAMLMPTTNPSRSAL